MKTLIALVLLSVATVGIAKVYVKNMTAAARKKYSSSSSSLYSETRSTSSDSLLLSSDDSDLYYSDDSDSSSALYSYSVYHTKYPPIASNELPKDENYKDRYKDKKKKKKKKIKKKKNKNRKKDKDRKNRGKVLDLSGTIREKFAFAAMSSRSSESVVCSPTAAIFPAGMLIFGAEGSALSELLKGVGIRSRSDAHSKLKEVRKHFEKVPGIDVMVASRMYLSNRKKLRSRFQEEAESVFHACTAYVDMKQPSSAVQSINSWVSRTTGGQIHNFMRDNDVPVDGSLVLVNAISFKGKWKYPFKKLYKVPFHGSRGREDMGMMYIKEDFMHGTSYKLDAQIVEIPYRDNGAKFMIILPHSLNGLNLLVSQLKLAPELLNSVILEKKKVNVYLPRFKITSSLNLRSMYKMVDIKRIFRDHDSSGLNKVVKDETIFVDNGIQKVTIDVNDDGTTGGVVSEMGGGMTGGMTGGDLSIVVKCDHPFMFFVLWKKEQLFAGTFTN